MQFAEYVVQLPERCAFIDGVAKFAAALCGLLNIAVTKNVVQFIGCVAKFAAGVVRFAEYVVQLQNVVQFIGGVKFEGGACGLLVCCTPKCCAVYRRRCAVCLRRWRFAEYVVQLPERCAVYRRRCEFAAGVVRFAGGVVQLPK